MSSSFLNNSGEGIFVGISGILPSPHPPVHFPPAPLRKSPSQGQNRQEPHHQDRQDRQDHQDRQNHQQQGLQRQGLQRQGLQQQGLQRQGLQLRRRLDSRNPILCSNYHSASRQ